jgi:phage replication-related protein YjqB (UPF0714/DUF867 family)
MPDKFKSFSALAQANQENRDYCIRQRSLGSPTAVVAIHGGRIEPGTSEVAEAIAGNEFSFYTFEGRKAQRNRDLHITSHRFDEPACLAIVLASSRTLSIHGESSNKAVAYLGGKDAKALQVLRESLEARDFVVETHQKISLQGVYDNNICNRSKSGCGIQLELSKGLRRSFFKSLSGDGRQIRTIRFVEFVGAMREAMLRLDQPYKMPTSSKKKH